jgi:hypothetical protein
MAISPTRVLWVATGVVGASTALLPWVTGYGTILFQVVVLGAWGAVAAMTSGPYADTHHGPLWLIALLLNVVLFLIPAGIVWLVSRKRWQSFCSGTIALWCCFYLASLFFLFQATDGP